MKGMNVDQPNSDQNISRATEINFKLPKKAFSIYKWPKYTPDSNAEF